MDKIGKIIQLFPLRSGVSERGNWARQEFLLETQENYPRKMVIEIPNQEKIDRFKVQVGQLVHVWFDIDAHEWNGRWFNSVRAYDIRQESLIEPAAEPAKDTASEAAPAGELIF